MTKTQIFAVALLALAACDNSRAKAPADPVPASRNAGAGAPAFPAASLGTPAPATTAAPSIARAFEDDPPNATPRGFAFGRTGEGPLGRWVVQKDSAAPFSNVLAQLDTDKTSYRFPVAVLNAPVVKDVRAGVGCKMVSGRVDQACGIVVRYKDENNYYVTRANALEDNIRLYTVQNGKRSEIASYRGKVTPNAWHEYRLELRGDHFQIYWDGHPVLDHRDGTFANAGLVGVWTKADSLTYFDELRVDSL